MDNTQLGDITLEVSEGIGTITFFHPAHNSLPGKLLAKFKDTINEAGQRDDIGVIILKSAGDRTFCAGASFDELASINDFETGKEFFMGFANVINACRKCPKIIIGRVQGKAVGGGVGVASATDYCFATKFASVKLSELAVGIGPFVVGPACERKLGLSGMSQLAINATAWRSAEWAQKNGLYAEIFDNVEVMDEAIKVLALKLVHSNPEAKRLLKQIFWEGTEHWDELLEKRAELSGQLVLSDYSKNAIAKFKGK